MSSSELAAVWQRLVQGMRAFRGEEHVQVDKTEPPTASRSEPETSPKPYSVEPPLAKNQYRRTPDPAFGSRSAEQRQAYERQLQEREEEAERDAAQHSRERQHRTTSSQARH